jgi:subtilisin family serine protease
MRARTALFPVSLLLAACAAGTTTTASAPEPAAPAPAPAATRPAPPPPPAGVDPATAPADSANAPLASAPDAWQLLDLDEDRVPGVSAARAYRELLADRSPARTVVVAVIDGGVDTAHVDLRETLWRNADETPGNRIDDDDNGYVDDVYGWNFIGGADGRNVHHETLEVTRLHARCLDGGTLPAALTCEEIAQDFAAKRTEAEQTLTQIQQIEAALDFATPLLREAVGGEEPTVESVSALTPTRRDVLQAQQIFLQLDAAGIGREDLVEGKEAYEGLLQYGYDPTFETRDVVGDDFSDGSQTGYGNPDVMGPDASHGTHVTGIIGAARGNGIGMDGVASSVQIMTVRTVPDGDERDKDVANAIRYAVDNGAQIINMSFGKAYSPRKELVDAAVRYADERGVLMVHAAGNDGEDLEIEASFPTRDYEDGGQAANWIEVGAADWKVEGLAAPFSNYGSTSVDVFAPGVDILSTVPGSEFDREDGTSMAAPVVTGVAALLMAYFPDLTAADVKSILLESSVNHADRSVPRPGTGEPVPFGTLSVTGGVVNAYEAIRMALERM